jgi:hypothetical protein
VKKDVESEPWILGAEKLRQQDEMGGTADGKILSDALHCAVEERFAVSHDESSMPESVQTSKILRYNAAQTHVLARRHVDRV